MSVFSRPMGQGRMGLYNWGGTAVGAGVGAAGGRCVRHPPTSAIESSRAII